MAWALYNNNIRTGNSVGRFVCGSHDGFLKESDKKKNELAFSDKTYPIESYQNDFNRSQ